MIRNERGALQVPLLFALALIVASGTLFWGMFRHWRRLVETQLRIDRCTGEVAQSLESTLETIDSGNRRLEALRASMAASPLLPGSQAPISAAMLAEATRQDMALLRWKALSVAWITRARCGSAADQPAPLPRLEWLRPPPDPLGPRPLVWSSGIQPDQFILRLSHPPRLSGARVWKEKGLSEEWNAKWVFPKGRF